MPAEQIEQNQQQNRRLPLSRVGEGEPAGTRLAVVGGAPRVEGYLDTLRVFAGEIWAINGTWRWLRSQGIDAVAYSIDPAPGLAEWFAGAARAVLADTCAPATFAALAGAEVVMAELGEALPHGTSSASSAPLIAAERGHVSVTLYGIDCSFDGATHIDRDEGTAREWIKVAVGGQTYTTRPDLLMQAEELAEIVRAAPGFVRVVGGGLLPALVAHGDYEVTHVSRGIYEQLRNVDHEQVV